MTLEYEKYIFCLEGEWDNSLKSKSSILPTLEFLEDTAGVNFLFRKVALPDDLYFYLDKAIQKSYKKFSIIHLAFHGTSQNIWMADSKTTVSLKELADEYKDKLVGKVVHFGSCSTLRTKDENLLYFLETTKAEMVSGFTKDVEFIDSSIFEIAYFFRLQEYRYASYVEERMKRDYPGLFERLGFRAFSRKRKAELQAC
jgi:hypothetical protein